LELKEIDKENPLYGEAQLILQKIDSLKEMINDGKNNTIETINSTTGGELSQKEELERELKSITEGIDFSKYRGTVESLQLELVLFEIWAKIIKESEVSSDSEIQTLARKLKSKVENIQNKEFPILRQEYASFAAKIMWENDIEVYTSGTANGYINFIGGTFVANKNKQALQEQLQEILTMFRFKQSRYRWYKGDDEYTYWTIYKGKDSELVNFNK